MENIVVNKAKTNLWIDIIVFVVFLVVYEVKATGETIHEWLGVAIGLIFIIHILMHWKWLILMTKQFLTHIKAESRLNYIVDILIFAGFTSIIFSGIMISKSFLSTFGIHVEPNHFWKSIHSLSVDLTLFLTAFHFAMHWNWVLNNFKRYIIYPLKKIKNTKSHEEPEFVWSNTSKSSNFSTFLRISAKFAIILIFSGIISLGWYTVSAMVPTEPDFKDKRPHIEQDRGVNHFEGSDERTDHNPDHDKHHGEKGLFVFEILKNLFIFSAVTVVVTVAGKKINRRNAEQELKISSQK